MRAWAFSILSFLVLTAAASPAVSADEAPPAANNANAGRSVEMPYLIAPVIVEDKLIAYAYVSSRIVASSGSAALEVSDKLAFIQDAFVRDVNARPIGKPDDPATVDQPGIKARLLADTRRIMGAQKIEDLQIIQIQVTQLRPDPRG
jgi:hypothetical protein